MNQLKNGGALGEMVPIWCRLSIVCVAPSHVGGNSEQLVGGAGSGWEATKSPQSAVAASECIVIVRVAIVSTKYICPAAS